MLILYPAVLLNSFIIWVSFISDSSVVVVYSQIICFYLHQFGSCIFLRNYSVYQVSTFIYKVISYDFENILF